MGIVYDRCIKYTFSMLLIIISITLSRAQVEAYPPFWWKNMQNDSLHLIIYSAKTLKNPPVISGNAANIIHSRVADNPHYAFVSLLIDDEVTGSEIEIKVGHQKINYQFKERQPHSVKGLNQSDVLYLISPDRFANGDTLNDLVKGMNEEVHSRDSIYGRHGGDIMGIQNHLDYIHNMGFNALWLCPVLTNDQFRDSYHGYAITDHYSIDPRFGNNTMYKELVDNMHARGMKMVMDVVYNHVGTEHHLFKQLPDSNFFHFHEGREKGFLQTNYRAVTLFDPHASDADKNRFKDGWFVSHMPDVNQNHEPMAQFLIQNSIWWIEEFGLDAFRVDTYTYPDQVFMGELARRIKAEYPDFFIFGETWVHGAEIQSYFVENNPFNPVQSNMDAVTDFQLAFAIQEALVKPQGWTEGIAKVYYTLAADYLYEKPEDHVTFLDNHDLARIFGHVNGDLKKLEVALGMLFTMRGIPCMYYGTEVLMRGVENHGVIREDFSGGWPTDEVNKFDKSGRSEDEEYIHNYISELLKWRANSKAITQGKLKHFVPEDGVYVYFRYHSNDVVMVVANTSDKSQTVDLNRFKEIWPVNAKGVEVLSQKPFGGSSLKIGATELKIFNLKH